MDASQAPMEYEQDEVGEAGKPWDLGTYPAKLLDVQVVDNTMGVSLLAIFQVTDGPKAGEDLRVYRSLKPYQTKDGGWWVPGLREIKADLVSVNGLTPGEKMTRDAAVARVQYAKGLARKEVEILVYEETYKDKKTGEMKTVNKKRVAGLVGGNAQSSVADGLA